MYEEIEQDDSHLSEQLQNCRQTVRFSRKDYKKEKLGALMP